jgi:pyrroloquinoline quinone biosynthesis protein B
MKVLILGSAAGGGLPQWNCHCENCKDARAGGAAVTPRTQSSIAVSSDGERWVLFNASPDLRIQITTLPIPRREGGIRGSAVSAVFLTDAELDHTAGLLLLREGRELLLYSTAFVREALLENGFLSTLAAYLDVDWDEVVAGVESELKDRNGNGLGLRVEAFEVAGGAPLYYRRGHPSTVSSQTLGMISGDSARSASGHTIGVKIHSAESNSSVVYVPGAGRADESVLSQLSPKDTLLWDGTFWTDDELVQLGISERRAAEMGHLPISGAGGSLESFREVALGRKVYIHINNTNPILREGSPQRLEVEAAGWEVGYDGMEVEL